MIARIWHGVTEASKADEYLDFLNRIALPDYQATPGNCGVSVLRHIEKGESHFLLITLWESMDAVKQFSGEDTERAKYYPEDKKFLLEFEPYVKHYEVMVADEVQGLHQCCHV